MTLRLLLGGLVALVVLGALGAVLIGVLCGGARNPQHRIDREQEW